MIKRLINTAQIVMAAVFVALLTVACNAAGGSQEAASTELTYLPQSGNFVLIFTHRFNEADYEEGKQIVVEEFSAAIEASGQTRRTYFLENVAESEFVAISFFHSDSSAEEWLNSSGREEVLSRLEPLYRESLEIQHLIVEEVHDTH